MKPLFGASVGYLAAPTVTPSTSEISWPCGHHALREAPPSKGESTPLSCWKSCVCHTAYGVVARMEVALLSSESPQLLKYCVSYCIRSRGEDGSRPAHALSRFFRESQCLRRLRQRKQRLGVIVVVLAEDMPARLSAPIKTPKSSMQQKKMGVRASRRGTFLARCPSW